MGLISDYLEQCRAGSDIDPCMLIKTNLKSSREIYYTIQHCKQENSLLSRLKYQADELEKINTGYILSEKFVLFLKNNIQLQSPIVEDILGSFLIQLKETYLSNAKILLRIYHQIKPSKHIELSEKDIRQNTFQLITNSITLYLQNNDYLDTNDFRKIVRDMAALIKLYSGNEKKFSDKMLVSMYIKTTFQKKDSVYRCSNCGKFLIENIPYCFNCYERN